MSAQSGYYHDVLGSRKLEKLGARVEHTLGNEAKPDAIDADVALARPWGGWLGVDSVGLNIGLLEEARDYSTRAMPGRGWQGRTDLIT
jgi:hypothetical protein